MRTHLDELETTWHDGIPITVPMGVRVLAYDGACLSTAAPLDPNVNVHGTAFAGSLYALATLTGWGRTWLWLRERDLEGAIVIARAEIRYASPVTGDLVASCTAPTDLLGRAATALGSRGRCRLPLTIEVRAAGAEAEAAAAVLEGTYAITAPR